MAYLVVPAVGLVLWLVHVSRRARYGRSGWAGVAWAAGLPVASVLVLGSWVLVPADPAPPRCPMCWDDRFDVILFNGLSGLALWLVLVLLEVPVRLLTGAVRRRKDDQ